MLWRFFFFFFALSYVNEDDTNNSVATIKDDLDAFIPIPFWETDQLADQRLIACLLTWRPSHPAHLTHCFLYWFCLIWLTL